MTALGGGTWLEQDKELYGAYVNVASAERAPSIPAERGYVALALPLNLATTGEIIEVEKDDIQGDSIRLFGCDYLDEELKPLRELLIKKGERKNKPSACKKVYLYNLNTTGEKATATIGTLKIESIKRGAGGNNIHVVIQKDINEEGNFIVEVFIKDKEVFTKSTKLIKDLKNDFVDFTGIEKLNDEILTVSTKLSGGTTDEGTAKEHNEFLTLLEEFDVNAVAYVGDDEKIKTMYESYTTRMNDEVGLFFQVVLYSPNENNVYDNKRTIEVYSETTDNKDKPYESVIPALAIVGAKEANESADNELYQGEYNIKGIVSSTLAKKLKKQGKFLWYKKRGETRLLADINSFVTHTEYMTEDFSYNQIVRVTDKRAIQVATRFNKYKLGKIQNRVDERIAFWNEIVQDAESMQNAQEIQNYTEEDTVVMAGNKKGDVLLNESLQPVLAMQKLYYNIAVI